jgi:hypothetical protein
LRDGAGLGAASGFFSAGFASAFDSAGFSAGFPAGASPVAGSFSPARFRFDSLSFLKSV